MKKNYDKILVSIVTPTYNRAHLLNRIWKSIKLQHHKNFEWILVNDGSVDNTDEIVKKFKDKRIIYLKQKNKGMNGARNFGDTKIKGEYVIYLDSDDEFLNSKSLSIMVKEIEDSDDEISGVFFPVVSSKGTSIINSKEKRSKVSYEDFLCERAYSGEFLPIWKKKYSLPWPDTRRVSGIRHLRILKKNPFLFVNIPTRKYNIDSGDNMSSVKSSIKTADDLIRGLSIIISEHKDTFMSSCPCVFGKHNSRIVLYRVLSGDKKGIMFNVKMALKYGKLMTKIEVIVVFSSLIFPLVIRRKLFLIVGKLIHKY